MATRRVATVFGGSGFIGRYLVKRLAKAGYVVRIAVRDPEAAQFLRPLGSVGQIVPLFASLHEPATITRAVVEAEVVLNLVGILAERRRGDFAQVHTEGPRLIARDAAASGVARLIHVSAIGADPASPSMYARSKGLGEEAVRTEYPAATILRPSIVFGMEDQFFNRFAAMAQFSPVLPVISGATRFQPVYVGDVADAAMAAIARPEAAGRRYELGGPRVWTFRELLEWLLKTIERRRRLVDVPMGLARLQAGIAERLPGKPLTRDQLLLLARDNVVAADAPGLDALGVVPTPVELLMPRFLVRYRPGGGHRDRYVELQDT
ncbi:MAG: complex I NDUFA9 subunit family protein, partial [Acidisphaera sp.]|nr:complex I NDUFA9 subunit family protein [Acidisphaera sp.]